MGTAIVLPRDAKNSYTIKLKPGVTITTPIVFLKECIETPIAKNHKKLHYHPKVQFKLTHESEVNHFGAQMR